MRPQDLPSGKTYERKKPMTPVCLQWKHRKAHVSICPCIKLALDMLLVVSTIKDDFLSLSHSLFAGSGWHSLCNSFSKKALWCRSINVWSNSKKQLCKQRHFLNIICNPCLNLMSVNTSDKRKMTIFSFANRSTIKQVYFHKIPLRSHHPVLPPHFWTTSMNRIWKKRNSRESFN